MIRRSGVVLCGSAVGLIAATAVIRQAAEHMSDDGAEPRWPGQNHREPGRSPKTRDWEFRSRKGRRSR